MDDYSSPGEIAFRVAAWLCIVISAASSMVISYAGLAGLAQLVGYTTVNLPLLPWAVDASALLPVAIDVAIVASTLVWLGQGAPRETTNYARGLALVAIATSVLANATYHGLTGGGAAGSWWLASLVAAVPPAFLAALVHLGALLVRTAPTAVVEPTSERQEPEQQNQEPEHAHQDPTPAHQIPAEPAPEPGATPGEDQVTSRNLLDEVARIVERAEAAGLRPPGRGILARQLDVSEHEVRQALEKLRQERAGQPAMSPAPAR
ncbi:hypothetical protein [Amycolatopsis solani]|uniref:hypothetical protein n=1 Tax=Amycolatopsis solani TaxID=3028615 RepID=UPI0025B0F4AF|nr:hypothetical protein [Amycolatopsis sp. MEP2-6]